MCDIFRAVATRENIRKYLIETSLTDTHGTPHFVNTRCENAYTQGFLTHWDRVTHICVSKRTIIGSDNGLSPGRRQAITWTNAGILLIRTWGTNFSEILIEIIRFSFKKMRLKVSSAKRWPFCLGLNVLNHKAAHKFFISVIAWGCWGHRCTTILPWSIAGKCCASVKNGFGLWEI